MSNFLFIFALCFKDYCIMTKFITLVFRQLPNAAHFNFCSQVNSTLETAGEAVRIALGELVTQFNMWYDREAALMVWVRKSLFTELIAEADKSVTRALVFISSLVKSAELSTDPHVEGAAGRIGIMLKNYGYIYQKSYEEKEGLIKAVLSQFAGEYSADAQVISLNPGISELQAVFTKFQQLLEQRDIYSLQKPRENFLLVRRSIEKTYHKIVRIVNAGATLNMSADFEDFINRLNPEIERLNAEFHYVKRDIADAEPKAIPQQLYTGSPITPAPEVFHVTARRGTVRLYLGRDYNLTYRNNVNVGNAECTLHGRNKFRGTKTVTFSIVSPITNEESITN
jgi:hypothetical protein